MRIIYLPRHFSLQREFVKRTISTLNKLIEPFRTDLAINFESMTQIKRGDALVLSAQIEKSIFNNQNRIYREGPLPAKKVIKNLIDEKYLVHEKKALSVPRLTDAERQSLVNPITIDRVVKNLKKIGFKSYHYRFNTFLTELISNAVEHGIQNRHINWWLTQEVNYAQKTITFTFVDMGTGIVASHKKAGVPFKYHFLPDSKIVTDSFNGRLGSSTKAENRGRGLQQLREMIEKRIVSDFVLITNKVRLEYKNHTFVAMKNPDFVGTYYSWKISQDNPL